MMRELRVEDALMYLDQVKMEFGDRPHIYNEFLDIMKTFKSQQIDTPGVIRRVSNLFQGNKKLVLGFNTFLPEGYKIELPSDESGQVFAVYRSPGQAGVTHIFGPGHPQGPPAAAASAAGAPPPPQQPMRGAPPQQQQPPRPPGAPGAAYGQQGQRGPPQPMQQQGGPPRGAPPRAQQPPQQQHQQAPPQAQAQQQGGGGGGQQPVEFDHAINYVTTIKKRFASEPETYKKFLEILHTYQKEQRGIKDVLDEVSALFADHPDLLKDFTYFLPDAVQAQAKAQLEQVAKVAEERKRANASKQAIMASARRQRPSGSGSGGGGRSGSYGSSARARGTGASGEPVPFGATQGRSEEKEREICRTAIYGIVSFDPIRPPRRNDLSASQYVFKYGRPRMVPELPVQATTTEAAFFQRARAHLTRKELLPDKSPLSRRHTPHTEFLKCLHLFGAGILNRDELLLLLKGLFMQGHAPKSGANAGGGAANANVAAAANQLIKELEQLLICRGPYAEQERRTKDNSKYGSVPVRDYDYTGTDQPTPSYRSIPSDFPKNSFYSHSGQLEEDAKVLNDSVICVPNHSSGKKKLWESPEEYDGIKTRKNFYEEAMAKAEDDHFEVDMAIERNSAAKRQVEPLAEEAALLRENEEKDGQPIGRLRYKLRSRSLSSNHIGAIARLYGDRGDEVLHHLGRNPLCVLPIVWRRLNEKDQEWRKARTSLIKDWRKVLKDNHEGSRDTQCFFNKKAIERCLSDDNILDQCEQAQDFAQSDIDIHPSARPFIPNVSLSCSDPTAVLYQPHLRLAESDTRPHIDAFRCLMSVLSTGSAKTSADRERASRIWADFVMSWFNVPTSVVSKELGDSTIAATATDPNAFKIVFGNENIYVCLRIYTHLVGTLQKAQRVIGAGGGKSMAPAVPTRIHPSGYTGTPPKVVNGEDGSKEDTPKYQGYSGLLAALKDKSSGDLPYAKYEMWCRDLSRVIVAELAVIPSLLDRIAEALVKIAKEDSLPRLYGLAKGKKMDDAVLIRTQSLELVGDASYRIQYRTSDGYVSFTYIQPGVELLTSSANDDDMDAEMFNEGGEPEAKKMRVQS